MPIGYPDYSDYGLVGKSNPNDCCSGRCVDCCGGKQRKKKQRKREKKGGLDD